MCVCARVHARVYIQRERHEWERESEDSTHQCHKMRHGQKQYGIVITFFGNFFYENLKSFQTKVTLKTRKDLKVFAFIITVSCGDSALIGAHRSLSPVPS